MVVCKIAFELFNRMDYVTDGLANYSYVISHCGKCIELRLVVLV